MNELFLFLLVLFIAAIVMRSSLFINLLYLFSGIYIVGRFWNNTVIRAIGFSRTLTPRAFAGEEVKVRLEIFNRSVLPAVWLRLEDALPIELAKMSFKRVITLPSRGKTVFEYSLHAYKRGCYKVGPMRIVGGDLFGLTAMQAFSGGEQILVVYPRVYTLPGLSLPSRSPMGNLRTNQPIFEDPTRVRSKRDYVSGDSLRRIDWKSTASSGRLQVKQFEPSIALETMIYLNLNAEEYDMKIRYDSLELAVVVGASIAGWVNSNQQAVGLSTNGLDPFASLEEVLRAQLHIDPSKALSSKDEESSQEEIVAVEELTLEPFPPLPPRKGQIMRILDILARVQPAASDVLSRQRPPTHQILPPKPSPRPQAFLDLIQKTQADLSWGTTLVLITGAAEESLFDTVFKLRRRGLNVVIALIGQVSQLQQARQRAHYFHIPLIHYRSELELNQQASAAALSISQRIDPGSTGGQTTTVTSHQPVQER